MNALKWFLVAALVATGVVGNLWFATIGLGYRVLGLLVLSAVAVAISSQTQQGRQVWQFSQEARLELRKVVWPSRTETTRMTIAVLLMVFFVGLFLWAVDAVVFRVVAWLTGLSA